MAQYENGKWIDQSESYEGLWFYHDTEWSKADPEDGAVINEYRLYGRDR